MSQGDKVNPPLSPASPTPGGGGEQWGSKLGVILAVAGSAVGLGNFLRFPGQAASYGGGAFMIPYFIAFLVVGIPIAWAEWAMGRRGGRFGFHSAPGIFSTIWRHPIAKYFGALALLIPLIIYMYYVWLESWCLAYAWHYATGSLALGRNPAAYGKFFSNLTGIDAHGSVFAGGIKTIFWFFLITFAINFFFIYRGLSRGIEAFCRWAMPALIIIAMIVVVRVLTLPEQPLPTPWQRSLARTFSAERWEQLRAVALNPETTPQQMQQAVNASLEEVLSQPGDHSPALVAPPIGFFATTDGISIAMAELRAGTTADTYRQWLDETSAKLPDSDKRQLQRWEREQQSLNKDLAKVDKALTTATPQDKATLQAKRERLEANRDAVESQRRALLESANPVLMPSFAAELALIKGTDASNPRAREALQRRAAALEVAELPRTVWNGLGYMWNPDFAELSNPQVWLAAAGQIFFSLSVGFGIVLNYSSYLKPKDDVVLSSLTSSATNEFCEVILGGLVAIPATFLFLGTTMTLEVISRASTLGLGFNTLPAVFAEMPGGRWFGMLWFFMLFLAGITSSLSMLQPGIAFLEEGFNLPRRVSVAGLGLLTISGSLAVIYFSKDAIALDTMDFWIGTFCIFVLATIQIILFGWVLGVEKGLEEAHQGANLRIPRFFVPILKYVTPLYLLTIFGLWCFYNLRPYLETLLVDPAALLIALYLLIILGFLMLLTALAHEQWRKQGRLPKEDQP